MNGSEIPSGPGEILSGPSTDLAPANPESSQEFSMHIKEISAATPEPGGTVLVLQRNAKDNRDAGSPEYGALSAEVQAQTQEGAKIFFDQLFDGLDEDEKQSVRVLVVASDATLITPGGVNSSHKRGLETAEQDISGILRSITEHNLDPSQVLINPSEDGNTPEPVELDGLVDLRIWESPEFVEYMKAKYGTGIDFFAAYEDDLEVDTREDMNVEGPADVAIRMREVVTDLTQDVAQEYHRENPGTRLVVWATSHYDSISPFVKGYVYQDNPTKHLVKVAYGGGISIKISPDNSFAETEINGETFQVPAVLRKSEQSKYGLDSSKSA